MSVERLNDDQLQEYLDSLGKKRLNSRDIKAFGKKQSDELKKYATLYNALNEQSEINLSENFSSEVMSQIQKSLAFRLKAIWLTIFAAVGFLVGIIVISIFWGKILLTSMQPEMDKITQIYSKFFGNLDINYSLLAAGVITLLLMTIFDHFVNSKFKVMSLFK